MRRRQFLGAISTATAVGLSGCAGFNPLSNQPDIPTSEQLEYIEYYPSHTKANSVVSASVAYSEDSVYINPLTFGDFQALEIYTVNPDGSGKQLATITQTESAPNNDKHPQQKFSKSAVTGGTILLLLFVLPNGTKYTYGAYYLPQDSDSIKQVSAKTTTGTTNTTDSN